MTTRAAALALALSLAWPAAVGAQESIFNLGTFGLPAGGESIRARGMGVSGLGLGGETFGQDNPAQLGEFRRAGLYLSLEGQETLVENPDGEGEFVDVWFPMGQVAIPAWGDLVLGLGYHQFLDFDAELASTIEVEGDTLPVTLTSEGAIATLTPMAAYRIGERTTAGVGIDVYLGSRERIRTAAVGLAAPGALTASDSIARDFDGVGFVVGAEHRFGERLRVSAAWRLRPTVESTITLASGAGELEGRRSDIELPHELSVGAAGLVTGRLLATASLRLAGWSGFSAPGVDPGRLEDAVELGGGIEWRPGSTILWLVGPEAPIRAGARYRALPLALEGEQVTEWAVTLGHGRRMGDRTRVDIAFETGKRGAIDDHGFSETFFRLGVGFAVFERWQRID